MSADPRVSARSEPAGDSLLADTLAKAFQEDPALCWILPRAEQRAARLPGLFRMLIPSARQAGTVFAAPGNEAVSLWRAPGQADPGVGEQVASLLPLLRVFGILGLNRALPVSAAMAAARRELGAYWYLQYVGVAPASQGRGFGGALVRAGLELAERDGVPAVLETSKRDNVALYQRLGFRVLSTWRVLRDGPEFWTMTTAQAPVPTVFPAA